MFVAGYSQNKTLGVGISLPNPNAALHVESPTNNQGFLMPRLTTAQRTSISPLSISDVGLMVYDTDAKNVFTWDGTTWRNTNGSAGSTGKFVVTNPTDTTAALSVISSGLGSKASGASFVSTNTAGGTKPTVYVNNAAGTGLLAETAAGWAIIGKVTSGFGNAVSGYTTSSDPGSWGGNFTAQTGTAVYASTNSNVGGALAPVGVYGESTGTGSVGGAFWIQNATNNYPALYAKTIGTGPAFRGETASGSSVMEATHTGTNASAGVFKINNGANNFAALYAETNGKRAGHFVKTAGTGPAVYIDSQTGGGLFANHNGPTGYAGIIQTINASNTFAALFAESAGSGPSIWANKMDTETGSSLEATHSGVAGSAGSFEISVPTNTSAGVYSETIGSGAAVYGKNTGAGNGFGGLFEVESATNTYPAIQAKSKGTGSAIRAIQQPGDGPGPGMDVLMLNPASTATGLIVEQQGLGEGARFNINQSTSSNAAIRAITNGTGSAIYANHTGASGDLAVFQSSSANVARIDRTGKGFFNGGTQASGADVAEMFDVEGGKENYEPGDVLVISESTDRTVERSSQPNSRKVVGVYATKPGVILTEKDMDADFGGMVPMGVIGVIPTKVCLENGVIKRGDLLVSSSEKGKAMKAIPAIINGIEIYPQGAILGKALENYDGTGKALIEVLVNTK